MKNALPDAPAGDMPRILGEAREQASRPQATFAEALHAATMMLNFGFIDQAKLLLDDLVRLPPAGQTALMAICRRLLAGRNLCPASALPAPSVMVAPNPGARRVLILFGVGKSQFWGVTDPLFIRRADIALIYLRDVTPGQYLGGLRGLGDNYQQSLSALRSLAADLAADLAVDGTPDIFCLGHSAAGYPALRFALDLGARGVVAFSGSTTLDPADAPDPGHKRPDEMDALPWDLTRDLVPLYAAAARPPKAMLWYGENHRIDRWMAERMRHVPGVTLSPLPAFEGHDVMYEMMRTGAIAQVVDALLSQ